MNLDPHIEVCVCECFGRDGLQSFAKPMATEHKLDLLQRIVDSGFKKIEISSFVPPKHIPQFADAKEVFRSINRPDDVRFLAFVPNSRGAQTGAELVAEGCGPTDLLIVVSASETHNIRNLNRRWDQTLPDHQKIGEIANEHGMDVIGSISTAFGCPYTGAIPMDNVWKLIDHYMELGAKEIQFGDTTGVAQPLQVAQFFEQVYQRYPEIQAIAHFHDVRGLAITNTFVAMEQGVRMVDTAFGGTGGRPHYQRLQDSGPTGNLCTEDFIAAMEHMGMNTGVSARTMLEIGALVEKYTGQLLFSHTLRSGLATDLKPTGLDD